MDCELSTRQVLVSAGATGGLGAVLGSILSPGDEVMIPGTVLALSRALCGHFGVRRNLPIMGEVNTEREFEAQLESYRTERTVAVYFNSPNNLRVN